MNPRLQRDGTKSCYNDLLEAVPWLEKTNQVELPHGRVIENVLVIITKSMHYFYFHIKATA